MYTSTELLHKWVFLFCNRITASEITRAANILSNHNKHLPHEKRQLVANWRGAGASNFILNRFPLQKQGLRWEATQLMGILAPNSQMAKDKATKVNWSTHNSSLKGNGPAPSPLTKKTVMGKRFQRHTSTPWLYPYRRNPQDAPTRADTCSISTLGLRTVRSLQDSLSKWVFNTSLDRELPQARLGSVRSTSYAKNLRVQNPSPIGLGSNTTSLWQQMITHMARIQYMLSSDLQLCSRD